MNFIVTNIVIFFVLLSVGLFFKAPIVFFKIIMLVFLGNSLLYSSQIVFTASDRIVPEKSDLKVYQGNIYFDPSINMGRGGALYWELKDINGKNLHFYCVDNSTLAHSNCAYIVRSNYMPYQNKAATLYFSEKYGVMELTIAKEKIFGYEERKQQLTTPSSLNYLYSAIAIFLYFYAIYQLIIHFDSLKKFISRPFQWRSKRRAGKSC